GAPAGARRRAGAPGRARVHRALPPRVGSRARARAVVPARGAARRGRVRAAERGGAVDLAAPATVRRAGGGRPCGVAPARRARRPRAVRLRAHGDARGDARVTTPLAEFRSAYAAHRASEGRAHDRAELLALPYLAAGPLARQWAVRAR